MWKAGFLGVPSARRKPSSFRTFRHVLIETDSGASDLWNSRRIEPGAVNLAGFWGKLGEPMIANPLHWPSPSELVHSPDQSLPA